MPDTDIVTDPTTGVGGGTQPNSTAPAVAPPKKQMTANEYLQQRIASVNNTTTIPVANATPVQNTTTPDSTPVKLTPQQAKDKWTGNPYLVAGRDKWGDDISNKTFPFGGSNVKDTVYSAARATNSDPSLIGASAMEEGMSGLLHPDKNGKFDSTDDDKFPVNGFSSFGLDNFGSQAKSLITKGLLPPDFIKKYKTITTTNEKGQSVTSSNFADEDAAVLATAAVLKNSRNNLDAYTKKTGITLTPRQEDLFNLAAFNLGDAGAQKMIESYKAKGYLKDDKFLDDPNFKPASYAGTFTHVQRRLVPRQVMNESGTFSDYKPLTQPQTSLTNQNRTDYNAYQDSGIKDLGEYIKQNPKTSLTPQMAGALQQDLNAHKEHIKTLVNTGQAVYAPGVTHENVGADTHKFSDHYIAANK